MRFSRTISITDKDLKLESLLFQWGEKATDKVGEQIEKLVSDKFKKADTILYRSLNLSPPAMKKLLNNESVHLDNRKYSSWSYHIEKTKIFGKVTIKYLPKKEDILININLFNKEIFGNEEIYYHYLENEVILKNSTDMLIINPGMVVEGVKSSCEKSS